MLTVNMAYVRANLFDEREKLSTSLALSLAFHGLLVLAMLGQLAQLLSGRSPVAPLLEVTVSVLFLAILNSRQTREFCTR